MDSLIRKGQATFFGDSTFPHGISRSGHFNKRESEELAMYGTTLEGLHKGTILPENDEERQFIVEIQQSEAGELHLSQLWKKYLSVVEKSRVHHGFSRSNGRTRESNSNEHLFT